MTMLELGVSASAAWAIAGLAIVAVRAWRLGTVPATATPAGRAWRGVAYAFGPGMSPLAKESASRHPFVYVAGVVYHAGVFTALTTLAVVLAGHRVSAAVAPAFAAMLLLALLAAVVLLVRRLKMPLLRAISTPDDYTASLLVDAWLATAAIACLSPSGTPVFLVASTVLGAYAPLGKIRHCVFFFLARTLYGARLGTHALVGSPAREARS